jgi:hypothetical protein
MWPPKKQRFPLYPTNAALNTQLLSGSQLSLSSQEQFLELGWTNQGPDPWKPGEAARYEFYFHHYHQCCSNANPVLKWCTHKHVCDTIQQLRNGTRKECEEALLLLLPTGSDATVVAECVEFTGRAALFLDLNEWKSSETLQGFCQRTVATQTTQKDDFRLPRSFNARSIAEVAGINLQWTRNLAEHLEVKGNDSDIAIFHCVTVLDLYEESPLGEIFPDGFIEETRRTIALMLPVADGPTRNWLRSVQRKRKIDRRCGSCPHLKASERHVRDFKFWGNRIVIAKEVFDEHQPKGILQVWRDNRNPVQWWTLWIAMVVFALTIIACVEGALQVYKAYHPST